MRPISVKAVLSVMLTLIFLFLAISGTALYFGKTGLILGIARATVRSAHTLAAVLMCGLVLTHVFLNRRIFTKELKTLGRRNENKKHD